MKAKKLSALLLAGLMAASAVPFTEIIPCTNFTAYATSVPIEHTDATSGEVGKNLTWSIDSEGTLTISGEGNMRDSDDFVIIGAGAPWDYHYNNIKRIIIGDKVGTLVYEYIIGYPNLTSIEVGENNEYHSSDNGILFNKDKSLLIHCPEMNSIKEYTIPDSVKTINGTAFSFCENLEEITIPDSVTEIGSSAFDSCSNLSVVNFPKNIEILGFSAFDDTPWLAKQKSKNTIIYINGVLIDGTGISDEKELPEGIRVIGGSAFENNTLLTELTLPETVTHISQFAFSHNETLTSVTIPDSVIHLGDGIFSQCSELKEVTIGNGITELPLKTFYLCKALNKVKISETVKKIDEMAFWGCYDLTSIDIPENVEFIGEDVFKVSSLWEPALETITIRNPECELSQYSIPEETIIYGYKNSTAQEYAEKYNRTFIALEESEEKVIISGTCGENARFVLDSEGTLTISGTGTVKQPQELYVPEENELLLQVPKYSVKKIVVEEGITEIGMMAFNKLSEVTSLILPESLQIINANSFEGCTSLKSVKIPDSVTSLGLYSFANCTSLEEVILPNNDEYTCICPFLNCDNLNNIVLGDKTTHISEFLFSMCTGLKEFTIPDNITFIDFGAFDECTNLTKITLPDSIESIYLVAFRGCSSLNTVTIPKNVSEIAAGAFLDCPELTEILVDSGNTAYTSKDGVLFTKDMSTLVQYPEGKGDGYVIPESVTYIYDKAFEECDALTSIILGENITKIGSSAFEECVNLKSVKIMNPNCEIYDDYSIPEETIIYGYKNSTAQEYAEKYNRTFIALESDDTQLAPTLLGDANCDGKVSIADATAILQSIGNPDKYALSEQGAVNADIADTGNGITINDAVAIQKIDAGM